MSGAVSTKRACDSTQVAATVTRATIDFDAATARAWDVIVVGAGPAGSLTARLLAQRGVQVVLIDRKRFPRDKVCGACLNDRALSALRRTRLTDLLDRIETNRLTRFQLFANRASAYVPLPEGAAISRSLLDAELVRAAVASGAEFLDETRAVLGDVNDRRREVALDRGGRTARISARMVVVASGLGSEVFRRFAGVRLTQSPTSRIGAGAVLEDPPAWLERGTIYMAVAPAGYVGMVRLEDERLNLAAALDPESVRRTGSLAAAVTEILNQSNLPKVPEVNALAWQGTVPLTRRPSSVACERVLAVGDAAGYIEPFTGEGMAFALEGAELVAPLAARGVTRYTPEIEAAWIEMHRRDVARRQLSCRALAIAIRHPRLVHGCVRLLSRFPKLATPLVTHFQKERKRGLRWASTLPA